MSDNNAPAATENTQSQDAGGADDSGPVVDFGELLAQHQSQTGKTVDALRAELEQSRGVLGRVQKAFTGETDKKLTAHEQRRQQLDQFQAYLADKGKDLPLTSKIGQEFADFARSTVERNEQLESELAEIKAAIKKQQNPAFQGLERAAFNMEGMVEDALSSMYGGTDDSKKIRSAQFNAVTARINDEIKDLMKNDPEALLKIQRNPKIQRQMVNHFMAEMLPPKVRTMLDDQRIQNEPMSTTDLYTAFAEAKEQWQEAQASGNERAEAEYSSLMTSIRQDLLAAQQGGRRTNPDRPSLNQLFGRRA